MTPEERAKKYKESISSQSIVQEQTTPIDLSRPKDVVAVQSSVIKPAEQVVEQPVLKVKSSLANAIDNYELGNDTPTMKSTFGMKPKEDNVPVQEYMSRPAPPELKESKSNYADIFEEYKKAPSTDEAVRARDIYLTGLVNSGIPQEQVATETAKFAQIDQDMYNRQIENQKSGGASGAFVAGLGQGTARLFDVETRDDYKTSPESYKVTDMSLNPMVKDEGRSAFLNDMSYTAGKVIGDTPLLMLLAGIAAPVVSQGIAAGGVAGALTTAAGAAFIGGTYLGTNKAIDNMREGKNDVGSVVKEIGIGAKDFGLSALGGETSATATLKLLDFALPKLAQKTFLKVGLPILAREGTQQYIFDKFDEQRLGRPLTVEEKFLNYLPSTVPLYLNRRALLKEANAYSEQSERPIDNNFAERITKDAYAQGNNALDAMVKKYGSLDQSMEYFDWVNKRSGGVLFKTPESRDKFQQDYSDIYNMHQDNKVNMDLDAPLKPLKKSKESKLYNKFLEEQELTNKSIDIIKSEGFDSSQMDYVLDALKSAKNYLDESKPYKYQNSNDWKTLKTYFNSEAIADYTIDQNKNAIKHYSMDEQGHLSEAEINPILKSLLLTDEQVKDIAVTQNLNTNDYTLMETIRNSSIFHPVDSAMGIVGKPINKLLSSIGTTERNTKNLIGEPAKIVYSAIDSVNKMNHVELSKFIEDITPHRNSLSADDARDVSVFMWTLQKKTVKDGSDRAFDAEGHINHMVKTGELKPDILKKIKNPDKWFKSMSEEQKTVIAHRRNLYDNVMEKLNRSLSLAGEEPIEGVPFYSPIMLNRLNELVENGYDPINNIDAKDYMLGYKRLSDTKLKINIKERKGGGNSIELDPFKSDIKYMSMMIPKINGYPVYKKFAKLADALGEKSPANAKLMRDMINYKAGAFHDGAPLQHIVRSTTQKFSKAALYARASTVIAQPLALVPAIIDMGPVRILNSIDELLTNPQKYKDIKNSSAILTRIFDIALIDMNESKYKAVRKLDNMAKSLITIPDGAVAMVAYNAKFNQMMEEHGDMVRATNEAGEFINKTQASGARENVPKVMRYAYGKLVSPFMTYSLARFHYFADLMGLQPVYKFTQNFDNKDRAKAYAREKGYMMRELPDGTYSTYDARSMKEYAIGMLQLSMIGVAESVANAMIGTASAETGLPLGTPSADGLNAWWKSMYGITWQQYIAGDKQVKSELPMDERRRRAKLAVAKEYIGKEVPYAGHITSGSTTGGLIGTFAKGMDDAGRGLVSGRYEKVAEGLWNASLVLGNRAVPLTQQILRTLENSIDKEERYYADLKRQDQEKGVSGRDKLDKKYKAERSWTHKFVDRIQDQRTELRRLAKEEEEQSKNPYGNQYKNQYENPYKNTYKNPYANKYK